MADYLPAGTATGNADATRAAPIAQAFFLIADIMRGIDDQPRMEAGMSTSKAAVLGPSSTFGIDFGVDSNGDAYVRGRAAADAAPPENTATNGKAAADATTSTIVRGLLVVGVLYLAYRLIR